MKISRVSIIITLFITHNVFAVEPDWTAYTELLQSVKQGQKNGVSLAQVDYAELKQSRQLDKAYQAISHYSVNKLEGHNEILAFYINSYNILALKMVVDHWPLESIKEVGSFFNPVWKKTAGMINGQEVSLDDIENTVIRPMGEPRIHFAIVCASVSCPDLRNEPYTAAKLNKQLDHQVNVFLRNPKKGLRIEANEIVISKIFKWFKTDFDKVGGVAAFIRAYRPDLPARYTFDTGIEYDWSVNARP